MFFGLFLFLIGYLDFSGWQINETGSGSAESAHGYANQDNQ